MLTYIDVWIFVKRYLAIKKGKNRSRKSTEKEKMDSEKEGNNGNAEIHGKDAERHRKRWNTDDADHYDLS
jgi:hypothetical protein